MFSTDFSRTNRIFRCNVKYVLMFIRLYSLQKSFDIYIHKLNLYLNQIYITISRKRKVLDLICILVLLLPFPVFYHEAFFQFDASRKLFLFKGRHHKRCWELNGMLNWKNQMNVPSGGFHFRNLAEALTEQVVRATIVVNIKSSFVISNGIFITMQISRKVAQERPLIIL